MYNNAIKLYHSLAITVKFSQTAYSVDEGAGAAQFSLFLSNLSLTPITIQVITTDRLATGK